MNRVDAVLEACRLRLRPILMTSLALTIGSSSRCAVDGKRDQKCAAPLGCIFFGMLGVTAFGLVLTPVFYVLSRDWLRGARTRKWRGGQICRPRLRWRHKQW